MNLDDIVEAFVSTIIIVIMLVIAITIWNQDVGTVLVDFLPQFVESIVWILVGAIVVALLIQLAEEF